MATFKVSPRWPRKAFLTLETCMINEINPTFIIWQKAHLCMKLFVKTCLTNFEINKYKRDRGEVLVIDIIKQSLFVIVKFNFIDLR